MEQLLFKQAANSRNRHENLPARLCGRGYNEIMVDQGGIDGDADEPGVASDYP